ncbi:hypothetical protein [Nocardioides bruguierae]|uniref:Uncharacterized protein n=1 Tax=Nocardioides bruguierae TaxID=2945102 RepID=A0A9X2D566_9ACTN|nr:hypothetical protein [Nocardioides bruguierae]MCM0619265.1 hypothetical protein [Nocardioides bruguierae]
MSVTAEGRSLPARAAVRALALAALLPLAACTSGAGPDEDADVVERGAVAVAVTVEDGRLLVQRRDEGTWSDPSDVGAVPTGHAYTSSAVSVGGDTVAVVLETAATSLPEGDDADDLSSGLLAVSTGPDAGWDTHDADPLHEAFVLEDGSAVFTGYGSDDGGDGAEDRVLVWRGGTFDVEPYAEVQDEVEQLLG